MLILKGDPLQDKRKRISLDWRIISTALCTEAFSLKTVLRCFANLRRTLTHLFLGAIFSASVWSNFAAWAHVFIDPICRTFEGEDIENPN